VSSLNSSFLSPIISSDVSTLVSIAFNVSSLPSSSICGFNSSVFGSSSSKSSSANVLRGMFILVESNSSEFPETSSPPSRYVSNSSSDIFTSLPPLAERGSERSAFAASTSSASIGSLLFSTSVLSSFMLSSS